jgi:adenylosuccinate synthase
MIKKKKLSCSNKVIIGLGFGDEGKGLFVDYLSSHNPDSLVVRFSGGHQCGHTVVTCDKRHVFANFGSGTLRGIPTYWSQFCTVEPIGLLNEFDVLKAQNVEPLIYIDERCPITTPYEIINNKCLEDKNKHRSCGVGFGETMKREETLFSLTFIDLFYKDILREKLNNIQKHYYKNFGTCDLEPFLRCCDEITRISNIKIVNSMPKYDSYLFEGSQGLLLDQHFGFFPNVTRSNTGCKNAVDLLGSCDFELFLVTRAYQTRHGNGFMTNEELPHNVLENPEETNKENTYQGKFRKALLDVSLLEYAMNKDEYVRNSKKKCLVMTCLDQITYGYRFTYKGNVTVCSNEKIFVRTVADILNIKEVYVSHSANSENIERINIS